MPTGGPLPTAYPLAASVALRAASRALWYDVTGTGRCRLSAQHSGRDAPALHEANQHHDDVGIGMGQQGREDQAASDDGLHDVGQLVPRVGGHGSQTEQGAHGVQPADSVAGSVAANTVRNVVLHLESA